MKIKILFLLTLIVPSFAFAAFDQNLKYGNSGAAVREMQNILIEVGCLSVPSTGRYLTNTYLAVKCFQAKNNLPSTGYFGPLTRMKFNAIKSQVVPVSKDTPTSTSPVTTAPSAQREKLMPEGEGSGIVKAAQSSTSPVEVGNGCLHKVKGDACSYGAAPDGICDNALNGFLLFCIPRHTQ